MSSQDAAPGKRTSSRRRIRTSIPYRPLAWAMAGPARNDPVALSPVTSSGKHVVWDCDQHQVGLGRDFFRGDEGTSGNKASARSRLRSLTP